MRQVLGNNHPGTLTVMNNLASTLGDQGKLPEAAAMIAEVLHKRQQILGNDHPGTLHTMNDLATMLRDQGKLTEAATIQIQVLEKRQKILGNDHPDTLNAMNNLALMLRDQRKASRGSSNAAGCAGRDEAGSGRLSSPTHLWLCSILKVFEREWRKATSRRVWLLIGKERGRIRALHRYMW